jgi:hypothetical protein
MLRNIPLLVLWSAVVWEEVSVLGKSTVDVLRM